MTLLVSRWIACNRLRFWCCLIDNRGASNYRLIECGGRTKLNRGETDRQQTLDHLARTAPPTPTKCLAQFNITRCTLLTAICADIDSAPAVAIAKLRARLKLICVPHWCCCADTIAFFVNWLYRRINLPHSKLIVYHFHDAPIASRHHSPRLKLSTASRAA